MIIDESAFYDFAEKYPTKSVTTGRTLIFQSEIPRSAYLITQGVVRVYSLDINGDESNINFLKEGAVLPVEYVFERSPASLFYYSAASDLNIVAVPIEELRTEVANNIGLRDYLFEGLLTKYVSSELHIQALEQTHAREKIFHILQYLVLRFGKEKGNNKWEIQLQLKQTDIANMIGVTRETTATELGRLKKKGIVSYSSFIYTVDMAQLTDLIGINEWDEIEIN